MVGLSIVMLVFWGVRDDSANFSLFLHVKKLHFSWGPTFLMKRETNVPRIALKCHMVLFCLTISLSFWKASIDDTPDSRFFS